MIQKAYFYNNLQTNDPHQTLALEEAMLAHIKEGEIILYLYTHQKTVVIGKNQNAWKECRCEDLKRDNGYLARRISGGGAVFHDLKNLNFSFIVSRGDYDVARQLGVILQAVKAFGVDAEFSGRNDILAAGKKFSGNAFCFKPHAAFHHGTLLIDVNTEDLSRYLNVSKDKIASKGIKSVRSRVCNLRDFNPKITNTSMAQALRCAFEAEYGSAQEYVIDAQVSQDAARFAARNATWEWQYGYTGDFDITISERFLWGGIELCLNLKNAHIEQAHLYSDAMDADFIGGIAQHLVGLPFRSEEMAAALRALPCTPEQNPVKEDLIRLIVERNF